MTLLTPPPAFARLDIGHSEQAGIGPGLEDSIAEIMEAENQRAKPDREAPEQAPEGAQDA